jgi:hypothetical protein
LSTRRHILIFVAAVALGSAASATAAERTSDVSDHWFPINAPGEGWVDACQIEATYARAGRTLVLLGGKQFTLADQPGGPDDVANAIDDVC